MRILGQFFVPSVLDSPIITREIEVDEELYNKSEDKDHFLKRAFACAILDELEVKCVILD